MIPLKDDIPIRRFPIVTVVLIAINVVVYFVFEQGLWELGDVGNERVVEYGAILVRDHHIRGASAWRGRLAPRFRRYDALRPVCCPSGPRSSPRCSCTAAAALRGHMLFLWIFGNNIEDSMGRLRLRRLLPARGLAALGLQVAWIRTRRPDRRGLGRDRRGARRLRAALSARPRDHADLHHHLLHRRHFARAARTGVVVPAAAASRVQRAGRECGGRSGVLRPHRRLPFGVLADQAVREQRTRGLRHKRTVSLCTDGAERSPSWAVSRSSASWRS